MNTHGTKYKSGTEQLSPVSSQQSLRHLILFQLLSSTFCFDVSYVLPMTALDTCNETKIFSSVRLNKLL